MELTGTITIVELTVTALCMIAVFYAFGMFRKSVGDYLFLKRNNINRQRELAARVKLIAFGLLTIIPLTFVIIGAISMAIPPANPVRPVTPFQLVSFSSFIIMAVTLAIGMKIMDVTTEKLSDSLRSELDAIEQKTDHDFERGYARRREEDENRI